MNGFSYMTTGTMHRPILPPPEARNTAQRVLAADEAWREALDAAKTFDGRCPMNGTRLFLNLSRAFHELFGDTELCERLVQHIDQELRTDFPPAPGKLL